MAPSALGFWTGFGSSGAVPERGARSGASSGEVPERVPEEVKRFQHRFRNPSGTGSSQRVPERCRAGSESGLRSGSGACFGSKARICSICTMVYYTTLL